ncbi:MAG: hypothetical protein HUU37_09055, partial [Bdellovibrionales bacterium]|nr:hypothetical protein [Bdellovibrionales bacterium]
PSRGAWQMVNQSPTGAVRWRWVKKPAPTAEEIEKELKKGEWLYEGESEPVWKEEEKLWEMEAADPALEKQVNGKKAFSSRERKWTGSHVPDEVNKPSLRERKSEGSGNEMEAPSLASPALKPPSDPVPLRRKTADAEPAADALRPSPPQAQPVHSLKDNSNSRLEEARAEPRNSREKSTGDGPSGKLRASPDAPPAAEGGGARHEKVGNQEPLPDNRRSLLEGNTQGPDFRNRLGDGGPSLSPPRKRPEHEPAAEGDVGRKTALPSEGSSDGDREAKFSPAAEKMSGSRRDFPGAAGPQEHSSSREPENEPGKSSSGNAPLPPSPTNSRRAGSSAPPRSDVTDLQHGAVEQKKEKTAAPMPGRSEPEEIKNVEGRGAAAETAARARSSGEENNPPKWSLEKKRAPADDGEGRNTGSPAMEGTQDNKAAIGGSSHRQDSELRERRIGRIHREDIRVASSAKEEESKAKNLYKVVQERIHYFKSLEELRDDSSTWERVEAYRVYLAASKKYYGVKSIQELLPVWIYVGEAAPEFIEERKSWLFWDRMPVEYHSIEEIPAPVLNYFLDLRNRDVMRRIEESRIKNRMGNDLPPPSRAAAGSAPDTSVGETLSIVANHEERPRPGGADMKVGGVEHVRKESIVERVIGFFGRMFSR